MNQLLEDCFFIKKNGGYQKVYLQDILYFEANGDYIKVYVSNQNSYLIRTGLSKIEGLLPQSYFLRIHRSYIVQLQAIESVNFTEGTIMIDDNTLPLSRQNRKKLNDAIVKLD